MTYKLGKGIHEIASDGTTCTAIERIHNLHPLNVFSGLNQAAVDIYVAKLQMQRD